MPRWYRLAPDQGLAEAQTYLGNMYETGKGVPPSYVQAHMWHNLVASRTSGEQRDSAVEARDRVAGLMIPTQSAEAQRLAREWDAAHPREPETLTVNHQPAVGWGPTSHRRELADPHDTRRPVNNAIEGAYADL